MRRLQAAATPLSHLSYTGALPRARVEQGFFRETSRVSRFSEELFRLRVAERGEEAKQLCVSALGLHTLVVTDQSFNVTTFTNEGAAQENKVVVNLGESIPGGGAHGTQLKAYRGGLALFLPTWDTAFLFGMHGGRCETIRLGKNASAFARRPKSHETTVFSNEENDQLIFAGQSTLRILEKDHLLTIELPLAQPSNAICEIKPFGEDQFLVERRPANGNDSSLGIIQRHGAAEFTWREVEVVNRSTQDDVRRWTSDRVGWSPSNYMEVLQHPNASPLPNDNAQWEVLVSPRVGSSKDALFHKWANSKFIMASVSRDSDIMEVVDMETRALRTIPIRRTGNDALSVQEVAILDNVVYLLTKEGNETFIRAFDTKHKHLERDLSEWRKMWGLPDPNAPKWGLDAAGQGQRRGPEMNSTSPPAAANPKHGKVDDEFHAGGNTFAGGTGGSDTAGLGGRGGPYRLDKGHKIHQISDELKQQVDKAVLEKARELGKLAWEERLKAIRMDPRAHATYMEARSRVQADLDRLAAVLESAATLKKERLWERNQPFGEIDDSRLVDGLVGERLIYKRRINKEPPPGSPSSQLNIRIVVDVSASMYRFQSLDGRLQRMIDTTLMLLEAVGRLDDRFRLSLAGHSGESPTVPLVEWDAMPENEGAIYRILETMAAHAQFCISGDNTVEAVYNAIENVLDQDEGNGGLVVVISDANLRRYGIAPSELAKAMTASDKVKAHVVFIASVRDEAEVLVRELPFGRAKVCLETADLPHVMRDILADASSQLNP